MKLFSDLSLYSVICQILIGHLIEKWLMKIAIVTSIILISYHHSEVAPFIVVLLLLQVAVPPEV